MKTIIIDQDAAGIAHQIQSTFPEYRIIGTYTDWTSGWAAIRSQQPDIVLVSPEPDDFGGLDLLEQLEQEQVAVAVLSEWATFAYEAQSCGAAFLLKPIKDDALAKTLKRIARRNQDQVLLRRLVASAEQANRSAENRPGNRIAVTGRDTIEYVYLHDIIRYETNRPYNRIILQNGRTIPVIAPLENLEQQHPFARVNRSCIINLYQVERYHSIEKILILRDGTHVELSRSYQANILQKLSTC